jgi:hypothetical protein
MSLSRIALLSSVFVVSLAVFPGCKKDETSSGESFGTSEDLLVADSEEDDETEQADDAAEDATDGTASDADADQGPDPAEASGNLDAHLTKVRDNPGKNFTPAGCITTTVELGGGARVATHVFNGCTGPGGKNKFTGTLKATWTSPAAGKLQVVREAKGFKIERIDDGVVRTVDRTVTVTFSKTGSTFTKTRKVQMTGSSSTGKSVSRVAEWNVSYDAGTKCVTRDGSGTVTHEGREFTRSVTGYKRCGVGTLGCPQSGTLTISRKKGQGEAEKDISLTVEFTGGRGYTVTRPNGVKKSRQMLWCRAVGEK